LLSTEHEAQTQALLVAGLTSHWGQYDASYNPDITELLTNYKNNMLVGLLNDQVVACGGWLEITETKAQLVRFSVDSSQQRKGVGSQILLAVERCVLARGITELILETCSHWENAISFYRTNGYEITHKDQGDTYFQKRLK